MKPATMILGSVCLALALTACTGALPVGDPEPEEVATQAAALLERVPDLFVTISEESPGSTVIQHKVDGGAGAWAGGIARLDLRYVFLPGFLASRTRHLDLGGGSGLEYRQTLSNVDLKPLLRGQYTAINRYCEIVLSNDPSQPAEKLVPYLATLPFELNSVNGAGVAKTTIDFHVNINCVR